MFSPSNEFFFVSTDCSLVKMTSYYLNPNLLVNLYAGVVVQFIINLVGNCLHLKIMWGMYLNVLYLTLL